MDLPTYTNIWRIEKRLYKIYDLRLPMPLPLVQIVVFVAICLPWFILLQILGLPFRGGWILPLYVVPPFAVTWLSTRPVIEGKRLTELVISQVRYFSEPRTWARLTPIREPAQVVVVGRVYRRGRNAPGLAQPARRPADRPVLPDRRTAPQAAPLHPRQAVANAPTVEVSRPTRAPQPRTGVPSRERHGAPPRPEIPARSTPQRASEPARPITPQRGPGDLPGRGTPQPSAPQPSAPQRGAVPSPRGTRPAVTSSEGAPAERDGVAERARGAGRPSDTPGRTRPPRRTSHEAETGPTAVPPVADDSEITAPRPIPPVVQPPRLDIIPPSELPAYGPPAQLPQPARPSSHEEQESVAADTHTSSTPPADDRPPGETPVIPGRFGKSSPPSEQDTDEETHPGKHAARLPTAPTVPPPPNIQAGRHARPHQPTTPSPAAQTPSASQPTAENPSQTPEPTPQSWSAPPRVSESTAESPSQTPEPAPQSWSAPQSPRVSEPAAERSSRPTPGPSIPQDPASPALPPYVSEAPQDAATASDEQVPAPTDQVVWPPSGPRARGAARPRSRSHGDEPATPPRSPLYATPPEQAQPARSAEGPRPVDRPNPAAAAHTAPDQAQPAGPPRPAPRPPSFAPAPGQPASAGAETQQPEIDSPAHAVRSGPTSPVRPMLPAAPREETREENPPGLRRLFSGGAGGGDADYEERVRTAFDGARRVVVLGCTGGAGQTVTGLMLGHTFAQHRGDRIVAVDVNPGPGAMARRTRSETRETLTSLITHAEQVSGYSVMRRYTSVSKSGLEVVAAGKNPVQALDDRDYALAMRTLDRFYSITLLDAAAAVVARILPYADQIVLVAPASTDAPRAVAMTFEWLDGHGYEELRSRAVTVINGVSRRSMEDVAQTEEVARGRCRALVRIPWDDHLSLDRAPRNELRALRAPTRKAYIALGGVVAGGLVQMPERYRQQEVSR